MKFDKGLRYSPEPDPSNVPLDAPLRPAESISTSGVFRLPADARPAGLLTEQGGPYCDPLDILVIGESGCVFGKPTMIGIE